jgi:hypothetical protein
MTSFRFTIGALAMLACAVLVVQSARGAVVRGPVRSPWTFKVAIAVDQIPSQFTVAGADCKVFRHGFAAPVADGSSDHALNHGTFHGPLTVPTYLLPGQNATDIVESWDCYLYFKDAGGNVFFASTNGYPQPKAGSTENDSTKGSF